MKEKTGLKVAGSARFKNKDTSRRVGPLRASYR